MSYLYPSTLQVIRNVIDRLHVAQPPRDCIRAVWGALSAQGRGPASRGLRRAMYAAAIKHHDNNRRLYARVMGGL